MSWGMGDFGFDYVTATIVFYSMLMLNLFWLSVNMKTCINKRLKKYID